MAENVDLIVIGAGPGGYEVAAGQAARGLSVVVIEKDRVGGTCLNRGCIPTKCLCAAAETIETCRNAAEFGVDADFRGASYAKAVEREMQVVSTLRDGVKSALSKCRLVEGEAVIEPDGTVRVGELAFVAPKVLIATGSRPAALSIPGAELAMSSDDFLRLTELPDSLVIVGGGVIGLEFAYIANCYGVEVTVIEYYKEILPPFDAELAKRLRLSLAARGIKFVTSAALKSITGTECNLHVTYDDKKGEQVVDAEAVMMAVGRRAVLPEGLAAAGIQVSDRGFIITDENMQTTRFGFYAVGDCNGLTMLAHVATAQALKAVGENVNLDVVPSAVFTNPELAMVGLTTEQCKAQGLDYVAKKALYRANGKAMAGGHTEGLVKVLIDPVTHRILGCHVLGAHASDLVQEAALAMANGLTIDRLTPLTIHSHPTLSELLPAALSL